MGLVTLVVIILVLAVLCYAIQTYLPGEPTLKNLACFVLIVVGVLYVLSAFLVGPGLALR